MKNSNQRFDVAKMILEKGTISAYRWHKKPMWSRQFSIFGKITETLVDFVSSFTQTFNAVDHNELEYLETAMIYLDEFFRECEEGREAGRRTVHEPTEKV